MLNSHIKRTAIFRYSNRIGVDLKTRNRHCHIKLIAANIKKTKGVRTDGQRIHRKNLSIRIDVE